VHIFKRFLFANSFFRHYKDIIEFKSQFNLEEESDEENYGITSKVKAEKACNVKIEENTSQ